jgi:hypothetical protein
MTQGAMLWLPAASFDARRANSSFKLDVEGMLMALVLSILVGSDGSSMSTRLLDWQRCQ